MAAADAVEETPVGVTTVVGIATTSTVVAAIRLVVAPPKPGPVVVATPDAEEAVAGETGTAARIGRAVAETMDVVADVDGIVGMAVTTRALLRWVRCITRCRHHRHHRILIPTDPFTDRVFSK